MMLRTRLAIGIGAMLAVMGAPLYLSLRSMQQLRKDLQEVMKRAPHPPPISNPIGEGSRRQGHHHSYHIRIPQLKDCKVHPDKAKGKGTMVLLCVRPFACIPRGEFDASSSRSYSCLSASTGSIAAARKAG